MYLILHIFLTAAEMTELCAMEWKRPQSYATASQFDIWALLGFKWREFTRAQLVIKPTDSDTCLMMKSHCLMHEKSFSGFPSGIMLILILIPAIIVEKETIDLCFLLWSWLRNTNVDCVVLAIYMFASTLWTICYKYNLAELEMFMLLINAIKLLIIISNVR